MPVVFSCRAPEGAVWSPYLARRARQVLRVLGIRRSELSLSLVADVEMRVLNCNHRGKDRPTDVLAFPLYDPPVPAGAVSLGDVVISIDTAARAARERRRPLAAVLDELLVHGVLHLLGYDHEISPAEERRMTGKTRQVRTAIGSLVAPPSVPVARQRETGAAGRRASGRRRLAGASATPPRAARGTGRRGGRGRRG